MKSEEQITSNGTTSPFVLLLLLLFCFVFSSSSGEIYFFGRTCMSLSHPRLLAMTDKPLDYEQALQLSRASVRVRLSREFSRLPQMESSLAGFDRWKFLPWGKRRDKNSFSLVQY